MTMAPLLTLHGLLPRGFRLHSLPVKLRTGSGDIEYPSSSKSSRANHGTSLGGPWMPKRVGRGMTAQLNGMIMGGCLTEIARGNETRNYVTEPLPGSTNQHLSFAFPRLPLRLHTGMVAIITLLTCPHQPRAWLTICRKGAQTRRPDSTDRVPSLPYCRTREGRGDYQRDMLVDRFTRVEIGS